MKKIIMIVVASVLVAGCNEGIDPISSVAPGPDEVAPTVVINNPSVEKVTIPFTDTKTAMNFEFEVTDDIELTSITVSLDGTKIKEYNSFKDYRRSVESYIYEDLPIGDHAVTIVATDLSGKSTTKSFDFEVTNVYEAKYPGEVFYMPFEGGVYTDLLSNKNATIVGSPGFADGKIGKAYSGSADEYLTFPTAGIVGDEFSATFWFKPNSSPDRSGILTIGPPDPVNPATPNNRTSGFRFFREGSAASQTLKLNVGNGTADSWNDGGSLDPSAGWVHLAITISATKFSVYFNGVLVREADFTGGISWSGCDILSIASGAPRFTEWGHLSDLSLYDELRIFDKALTEAEVQAVMNGN